MMFRRASWKPRVPTSRRLWSYTWDHLEIAERERGFHWIALVACGPRHSIVAQRPSLQKGEHCEVCLGGEEWYPTISAWLCVFFLRPARGLHWLLAVPPQRCACTKGGCAAGRRLPARPSPSWIALITCGPSAGSSEHSAQLGPGLPYPQASHAPGRPRVLLWPQRPVAGRWLLALGAEGCLLSARMSRRWAPSSSSCIPTWWRTSRSLPVSGAAGRGRVSTHCSGSSWPLARMS